MVEGKDFSVIFDSINEEMQKEDAVFLRETMNNTTELQDPIEKLQEVIMDTENQQYSILITT